MCESIFRIDGRISRASASESTIAGGVSFRVLASSLVRARGGAREARAREFAARDGRARVERRAGARERDRALRLGRRVDRGARGVERDGERWDDDDGVVVRRARVAGGRRRRRKRRSTTRGKCA